MAARKKILSGMRPTGKLHLGHLVGTLDNWVALQKDYECFFMVADWHALMGEYEDPQGLGASVIDNVADWIAAGIDPARSTLFVQSHVAGHLELHMIFSCLTPLGWLERCPTYKEQLREVSTRDLHTYGFLGYPVLQAADILLYKADAVPVGEDQLPHLELTREIARRFNSLYKAAVFPEPEAKLTAASRLAGLDGRKMSKSYNNTINLSDPADTVRAKVQAMITDPQRIRLSDPGHPDICAVFSYWGIFAPDRILELRSACAQASIGCTECKKRLASAIADKLRPLQERRDALLKDKQKILDILADGAGRARAAAQETLRDARAAMRYEL
ncbi:MAG: tryptophan--tRNA ligase [Candidatus Omnitrophica bacterium]|nr:tryptophan--tRNA ligase [Candidatus Omnitrophota bacterium]